MATNRLEAFSDGVLAIIITIMVLELKVPEGNSLETLKPLLPKFLSYVFSFIYIGIYWNNHHHLFHAIQKVNGSVLWANLHLLFWLSLLPFATGWLGENHFGGSTAGFYGFVLLMCAFAFAILEKIAVKHEGKQSKIAVAVKSQAKEIVSVSGYLLGIIISFFYPVLSVMIYYLVALIWIIPDKRMAGNI